MTSDRKKWTAVFGLAVTLVLAVFVIAWLSQDPWNDFCVESARDLPALIPGRLIVEVVGESRARLAGETREAVEASLGSALLVYNFSNRILLGFEDNHTLRQPGDHIMELRVYLHGGIPTTRIESALGRMCGNLVFVELANDPAVARLRFIHEFGHYFGLPHQDGTYMRTGYLTPDSAADLFTPQQLEILDDWNHPGTRYVPHWLR